MAMVEQSPYERILDQAGRLAPAEQLRLLAALVRGEMAPPMRHVITDLRGLGKAAWQGVDAQDYVNQERASWDGSRICVSVRYWLK